MAARPVGPSEDNSVNISLDDLPSYGAAVAAQQAQQQLLLPQEKEEVAARPLAEFQFSGLTQPMAGPPPAAAASSAALPKQLAESGVQVIFDVPPVTASAAPPPPTLESTLAVHAMVQGGAGDFPGFTPHQPGVAAAGGGGGAAAAAAEAAPPAAVWTAPVAAATGPRAPEVRAPEPPQPPPAASTPEPAPVAVSEPPQQEQVLIRAEPVVTYAPRPRAELPAELQEVVRGTLEALKAAAARTAAAEP